MKFGNSSISTRNLGHLGLVAGIIRQLGIVDRVDEYLGEKSQATKNISVGECVAGMILNGLGFANQALYLVSQFFQDKPIERLLGSNIKAEYLTDDALGESLDRISDADPTTFFSNITFPIATNRKYRRSFARLDSTTFSLEGSYEGFSDSPETDSQAISITYGRSKKHRPDLKQIVLSMINSGPGGIPFWAEPLSGNASDKKTFHESIARVRAFQKELGDTDEFCWVADSALYSKNALLKTSESFQWITRVPATIKEAKELVQKPDSEIPWKELENGYRYHVISSEYGDIKQRWMLIHSTDAFKKEIKTMERKIGKERADMKKALWHLSNEEFACETDAMKRFNEVSSNYSLHTAVFATRNVEKFGNRGRPTEGAKPKSSVVKIIEPEIFPNQKIIAQLRSTKGRFILATNDLDESKLSDKQILSEYKDLSKVERGFRFLKDPDRKSVV